MTQLTLQEVWNFFNQYEKELKGTKMADYGGSMEVGGKYVKILITKMKYPLASYTMIDFDSGYDLMKPIKEKFTSGICMDLLEHVDNPFTVAKNIQDSLEKGSLLFVTAPFSWGYHEYPVDYWRFTHTGLIKLFTKMDYVGVRIEKDDVPPPEGWTMPLQRVVGVFRKK